MSLQACWFDSSRGQRRVLPAGILDTAKAVPFLVFGWKWPTDASSAERLALRRVRPFRIINPMLESETLQQLTDLIVSIGAPRRVYLFGSQALGFASKESDIDVLVVVPNDIADTRALASAIRVAISEVVAIPCDVLVERESVFLERSELPTIERTILETGISLYAA